LRPGFVLATRTHVRLADLTWGASQDFSGTLGVFDLALELDLFPSVSLPIRFQGGLGPRWTTLMSSQSAIACAACVFSNDTVHGMAAYAGVGLEATCRKSPCVGVLLLFDASYGVGGHPPGANVYTSGETWVDTFGTSLFGHAGLRVTRDKATIPSMSHQVLRG
jgi:hypothetical protein